VNRGEIVIVAQRGLYEGKPRPAVIIQSDALLEHHPSILVCQLSTDARAAVGAFFRIPIEPSEANGLRERSIVMVDRVVQSIGGTLASW
jgi:mRNA interferase MazF